MQIDKNDYIGDIHDECATLRQIAEHLEYLSNCFYSIGNDKFGQKLNQLASDTHKGATNIRNSFTACLNEQHSQIADSCDTTLKTALAMTLLQGGANNE